MPASGWCCGGTDPSFRDRRPRGAGVPGPRQARGSDPLDDLRETERTSPAAAERPRGARAFGPAEFVDPPKFRVLPSSAAELFPPSLERIHAIDPIQPRNGSDLL